MIHENDRFSLMKERLLEASLEFSDAWMEETLRQSGSSQLLAEGGVLWEAPAASDGEPGLSHRWSVNEDGDTLVFHVAAHAGSKELPADRALRLRWPHIPLERGLALAMLNDWWAQPVVVTQWGEVPVRTQFLLWQEGVDAFGCMAPLVSQGSRSDLEGEDGQLTLTIKTFDSGHRQLETAACVVGYGSDVYALIRRVMARALREGAGGRHRTEKTYPEPFRYLGWCSWNTFYNKVSAAGIRAKMQELAQHRLPIRWALIDDGWAEIRSNRLWAMTPDPEKFPEGMASLVEELKQTYAVQWVGLWHTFNGHWHGIHPDAPLVLAQQSHLLHTKSGSWVPYPELERGSGFWQTWHSQMRRDGIDFVKVDNQGALRYQSRHSLPIGAAAQGAQYAIQASVALNLRGNMINCMSMTSELVWNYTLSNVTRSSDDFFPDRPATFANHLRQNVLNSLWLSELSWCDYDMFWSSHPEAAAHGVLRAISGGPVYVSDALQGTDPQHIWPLIGQKGEILRPDQPALPSPASVFLAAGDPSPLKVFNRIAESAVLALFDLGEPGSGPHPAAIDLSDIPGFLPSQFAVYEYFSRERLTAGREFHESVSLQGREVRCYTLSPVEDGVAVIGLREKYMSRAAVTVERPQPQWIVVTARDAGTLLLYARSRVVTIRTYGGESLTFQQDATGWTEATLAQAGTVVVVLDPEV